MSNFRNHQVATNTRVKTHVNLSTHHPSQLAISKKLIEEVKTINFVCSIKDKMV
jgi:hypothetical protein